MSGDGRSVEIKRVALLDATGLRDGQQSRPEPLTVFATGTIADLARLHPWTNQALRQVVGGLDTVVINEGEE
jgi:hypothetical protein